MSIPTGFRFKPSEEELVRGFLFPKVTGTPLPWVVFSDADDDSSPHWTTEKEGGTVKKTIYVFTRVVKASNKLSSARHSSGPKDIIHSDFGAVIGCSRMLEFECSKKESAAKKKKELGHWIMHEYCLDGEGLRVAGVESTDIVLGKITKCVKESDRRRPIQPPAVEGNGGIEVSSGGSMILKKRVGEELLEEEGCLKKHKSSSLNNNGDAEFNIKGCSIDMRGDFDFDYGNIDCYGPRSRDVCKIW